MRGKNKSESHCTETAQHHHHHESSFLIYIYYIIYSRLPCVWLQCPSMIHIESYFWSWTAFCVRNSVWKQKNVFVEWLAVYRRIKFFISIRRIYCMLCTVYIFLFLFSVRLWVVTLDRIAEFDSLGNRTAEMMWQVWELLTGNAQHKAEKTLLYNNIPCIQKYQIWKIKYSSFGNWERKFNIQGKLFFIKTHSKKKKIFDRIDIYL